MKTVQSRLRAVSAIITLALASSPRLIRQLLQSKSTFISKKEQIVLLKTAKGAAENRGVLSARSNALDPKCEGPRGAVRNLQGDRPT
jgi:hypothetical protein